MAQTYQEKLAVIRTRIARVGNTNPVAIARRMHRLGMDISPEEVAKTVAVIEDTPVDVAPAPEPPKKSAPKKTRKKVAAKSAVKEEDANG